MAGTMQTRHSRGIDYRSAWPAATLFARAALGMGFLSAVVDRFGLWGAPGTGNVAWGDFASFTSYTHTLAPYLPASAIHAVAWGATAAEIVLGCALVAGIALRWTAIGSGILLLAFAVSMFVFSGFQTVFNASVLSAAAAALLLALAPPGSYVLSIDHILPRRGR